MTQPPTYGITGSPLGTSLTRGAESWQFFAFVFAALITVGFALMDDISEHRWLRLLVRVTVGSVITYFTLFSHRGRNTLIGVLNLWKVEKPL